MKCYIEIINISDGWASISVKGCEDCLEIPMYLLPEHSRMGDVLQLSIHFSPFETLSQMKEREALRRNT